jgi:hypothetical protein
MLLEALDTYCEKTIFKAGSVILYLIDIPETGVPVPATAENREYGATQGVLKTTAN